MLKTQAFKIIVFLLLILLTGAGSLVAQQSDPEKLPPLNSDRPDRSQGPTVVPRGTLQIETGFEFQKDHSQALDRNEYLYPNLLLRWGLFSRAELRVNIDYKRSREKILPEVLGQITEEDKGFNDIRVGTKIRLYEGRGLIPQIGFLGRLTLPIGEKEFRPPHIAPGGSLLFSHELSKKVELQYNVGYEKQKDQENYQGQTYYALNSSVALTKKLKGYVEVFGQKPHHHHAENNFDTGFLYLLSPNFQVDVMGGLGLNESPSSYFASGGFTWRLPH